MRKFPVPNIFVSACIGKDHCRYDGTIISDDHVRRLKEVSNVTYACPEMAIGLGAPRESLRLVYDKEQDKIKFMTTNTGIDYTDQMTEFSHKYIDKLKTKDIDGFILKAKSPSCGISGVKLYKGIGKSHALNAKNPGVFGKIVQDTFTDIPIENERRLSNYNIRELFYIKLFTVATYRELSEHFTMKELVNFHSNNKYLFMTFHQLFLKQLGNIVANHNKLPLDEVKENYKHILLELLSKEPTKQKRINVLTHIYGYFKERISTEEKAYYFDVLDDYINNKVPYSNVITLLKGFAIRFNEEYILRQTILEPFPKELISVIDSGKQQ